MLTVFSAWQKHAVPANMANVSNVFIFIIINVNRLILYGFGCPVLEETQHFLLMIALSLLQET